MKVLTRLTRFQTQLAFLDALFVALFVVIGQAFHNTLDSQEGIWRTAKQAFAAWAPFGVLAALLGCYPAQSPRDRKDALVLLVRPTLAMAFAAPLGLFLRAVLLGQPVVLVTFAQVALPTVAAFIVLSRLTLLVVLGLNHRLRSRILTALEGRAAF